MRRLRLVNSHLERASEIDVVMMRRAIELANQAAAIGEVPVGAVVYQGEQVIATAHNAREASADPTGHAELIAIRRAAQRLGDWRLTGCSLAVTLEPCPMCAGAIVNARVARVVFGALDPKAGACSSLYSIPTDERLNHRVELVSGVLARDCGRLLSDFFRERRRINRARRLKSA